MSSCKGRRQVTRLLTNHETGCLAGLNHERNPRMQFDAAPSTRFAAGHTNAYDIKRG